MENSGEADETPVDAISVSLTFYFAQDPDPVPKFLVGRRGRNPKVAAYGFHLHSQEPGYDLRSAEVAAFLDDCVRLISAEVTPAWLNQRDCYLRAYITPHPGTQNGGLLISSSTLAGLAAVGATIEIEVI